jgi:hypothetical protein
MRAAASGDELAIITLLGLGVSHPERKDMPFHSPFDFDYMGRQAEEIAHEAHFAGAAFLLNQGAREFVPAWAILRKMLASEMNDNEPTSCHQQLNKPIWFVADFVDSLGKQWMLVWLILIRRLGGRLRRRGYIFQAYPSVLSVSLIRLIFPAERLGRYK